MWLTGIPLGETYKELLDLITQRIKQDTNHIDGPIYAGNYSIHVDLFDAGPRFDYYDDYVNVRLMPAKDDYSILYGYRDSIPTSRRVYSYKYEAITYPPVIAHIVYFMCKFIGSHYSITSGDSKSSN